MRPIPRLFSAVIAAFLCLAIAGESLAATVTWGPPVSVAHVRGFGFADADFDGQDVGVAWVEWRVDPPRIGVASSADGGATFSRPLHFAGTGEPAIAVCGGELNVVFARRVSTGRWQIVRAVGRTGGGTADLQVVVGEYGMRWRPDVACNAGRVFVSWFERLDDGWELHVVSAPRSDGVFAPLMNRGIYSSEPRGLRLAAAGTHAYAVFALAGRRTLYLKHWTLGSGPGFALRGDPVRVVDSHRGGAYRPLIAADGDRVAVAWSGCLGTNARVSSDHGRSWGARYGSSWCPGPDDHIDGADGPAYIDVSRTAVALTVDWGTLGVSGVDLVRTHDDFATTSYQELDITYDGWGSEHFVGYIRAADRTVLADLVGSVHHIRLRRQDR